MSANLNVYTYQSLTLYPFSNQLQPWAEMDDRGNIERFNRQLANRANILSGRFKKYIGYPSNCFSGSLSDGFRLNPQFIAAHIRLKIWEPVLLKACQAGNTPVER
jgi:hypothetical protein